MVDIFKDFDKLIPDKRIAKLAGKEFDVSKISTRLALEQAIFRDNVLKMGYEQSLKRAIELVAKICGKPKYDSVNFISKFINLFRRKITAKWLAENTNYEQLIEFIDFILEPLNNPKTISKIDKKKAN